jgi:hypothetical protein
MPPGALPGTPPPEPELRALLKIEPRATVAATNTPEPTPTIAVSKTTTARSSGDAAGIFGSIFSSALSSGSGGGVPGRAPGGIQEGDPALKQYLPSDSEFPSGYTPVGEMTFRTPDGISATGGMNAAMKMAISGNPRATTPAGVSILMTMVLKPDDLQALGDAFGSIKDLNKQDLQDAFDSFSGLGLNLKDIQVLDASAVVDGGAGLQMTIDMSGITGLFGGGGGVDTSQFSTMTMRMYFFARGGYAGAVMRMAFADTLPNDVDELALARVIDAKLKTAP